MNKDDLSRMKLPLVGVYCLAALSVWILTGQAGCEQRQDKAGKGGQAVEDQDAKERAFVGALRSANAFCQAWRAGDFRTARSLMSNSLIRRHSDDKLISAIVPPEGGQHAGYLLSGGKHLGGSRVAFKLQLYFVYTGQYENRIEKPIGSIVMVGEGGDSWKVDEFPIAELPGPAGE